MMKLLRLIITFILILATIFIFIAVGIIALIKFNHESASVEIFREQVIKYSALVKLLNLNEPGDAKFEYLDPGTNLIYAYVYYSDAKPESEVELWVYDMVKITTGKDAKVEFVKLNQPKLDEYQISDLNDLRNSLKTKNSPVVNIFYLSRFADGPTNIGLTIHKDTMFIFSDTLNDLTESKFTYKRLEQSTLMHEWGHLLGLLHSKSDNCVMSERVDVDNSYFLKGREIPTEYCTETLYVLDKFR
jgi:predicted Zn-dependent protease